MKLFEFSIILCLWSAVSIYFIANYYRYKDSFIYNHQEDVLFRSVLARKYFFYITATTFLIIICAVWSILFIHNLESTVRTGFSLYLGLSTICTAILVHIAEHAPNGKEIGCC